LKEETTSPSSKSIIFRGGASAGWIGLHSSSLTSRREWGPFVAAYLTSKAWTQLDIGLILTVGTLSAMVLQVPIGALVDLIPAKRLLAAVAVGAISGSALLLAFWPVFSAVLVAKVLHAIASCLAGPVLAAISLGLVGHTL
jgi:MFS family permease